MNSTVLKRPVRRETWCPLPRRPVLLTLVRHWVQLFQLHVVRQALVLLRSVRGVVIPLLLILMLPFLSSKERGKLSSALVELVPPRLLSRRAVLQAIPLTVEVRRMRGRQEEG